MRARLAVSLALLALIAACVQEEAGPENGAPAPSDACQASEYQGLIGQNRSVAEAMSLPAATRIIGPNDAVTADYRPDRLNVEYDAQGLITRISCY